VDLQYVSHVERMVASCLYWKGMQIRGEGAARWPHIEAWFDAFEQRPSYQATKVLESTNAPRGGGGGRWTNSRTHPALRAAARCCARTLRPPGAGSRRMRPEKGAQAPYLVDVASRASVRCILARLNPHHRLLLRIGLLTFALLHQFHNDFIQAPS